MKIKITRTDGTIVEAEGTPEECRALLALPETAPAMVPVYIPHVCRPMHVWPGIYEPPPQWTYTVGDLGCASTHIGGGS